MIKSVAQHQLELQSQNSISNPNLPPPRRGSFREQFNKFKILRSITKTPPPTKKLEKKISKIIEKNPKCTKYYLNFKDFQKLIYLLVEDSTSSVYASLFFLVIFLSVMFSTIDSIVTSAIETNNVLEWIEFGVSVLFLVEYTLRVISATAFGDSFFKMMFRAFTIIDLIVLMPFFLELGFKQPIYTPDNDTKFFITLRWIKALRVLKLGRYLRDTQVFYEGMKASLESFGFLTQLIAVVNMVGATAIYYAEKEPLGLDNITQPFQQIHTMADAMWFVLVTLATVGYGDYIPQTILGKIIASVLAVIGMLIFSLPIAILGNNFQKIYRQQTEADDMQRYKTEKFKDENKKHFSDSQKEVYFMNERISAIEFTNKAIITILTDSEILYKQVAKDLKNLYESLYADEDTLMKKAIKQELTEQKPSPFLGSKIDTRIKLYEKLNRAKRKINVGNLFKKVTTNHLTGDESVMNISKDLVEDANQDEKTGILNRNKPKKTIVPQALKSKKTRFLPSKIDLDDSDIIETDLGAPAYDVPSMEHWIKHKTKDITMSKAIESDEAKLDLSRIPPFEQKKKSRAFIKSHSVNNQNQFLTYYVQNLNFIPLALLEELVDESNNSSEDGSDADTTDSDLKKNAPRGRRASVSGETKMKFNLNSPVEQGRSKKRRKTRIIDTTKNGKMVPKNYDTKLWELTGKILERMDEKTKLENSLSVLEKSVDNHHHHGAEEIDRAIAAAQEEIKRLLQLKNEAAQVLSDSNTPFERGAAVHRAKMNHGNDSSLIDISMDDKNQKIEAYRHARVHMDSFKIPIIKEEDEMSILNSGNATPLNKLEYPRNTQKTLDNLRNSRWKMVGKTMNQ